MASFYFFFHSGVKYFCSHCGEQGHRKHYCPSLDDGSGKKKFKCRVCGEKGHNKRTCPKNISSDGSSLTTQSSQHRCRVCGQVGHNRRTCSSGKSTPNKVKVNLISDSMMTYSVRTYLRKGKNRQIEGKIES